MKGFAYDSSSLSSLSRLDRPRAETLTLALIHSLIRSQDMNPNPNLFFDSGMESSYSSSNHDSFDSVEDPFGDNERDDGGPKENFVSNASQPSIECNANSNALALENTPNAFISPMLEPEVGMMFQSEEQAYAFYNSYAKKKGFSVRKGHLGRRKDGTIRDRVYLCSFEGIRQKHCSHNTRKPRPVVRTNCMARIEYKVTREHVWVVSKVIYEHNHPLVRSVKSHLLRSHRKMLTDVEDEPTTEAQNLQVAHNENERVRFCLSDQSSYLHTNRTRELEKGDVQILVDYLKSKQLEDPSFFYAIQLDDKEQVTNVFWADPRSMIDYAYFGDVVLFDTTYRSSKNEIPIASFVGINHHKQAVLFGAAMLLDETTESFIWLFRTFMVAMSEKEPRTIFTDQCDAISRAVDKTLPKTCHRICLWHISHNVAKNISHLHSNESNFHKDFKNCIYEGSSEDDFLAAWVNLINKYDLSNNSYLQDVYATREKWALVNCKNVFSAGMSTVQWSESMKKHFKKHFNRKQPLSKFIEQYHSTLIQFRKKELYEDYRSRQTKPVLLVDMPTLNQAAESYTRLIYKEFEDEFKGQLSCLCEPIALDGTTLTFKVSLADRNCYGLVEFNPSNYTVSCGCKKFESIGILCMHALKVLNNNNILDLPSHYIIKRWTKYANEGMISNRHQSVAKTFGEEHLTSRFSRVCHKAITIAAKSAFSKVALDIFDQELDKMMVEVENLSRSAPLNKEAEEDGDDVDGLQQDPAEASKKRRCRKLQLKSAADRKQKKRAPQLVCDSSNIPMPHQPLQRQANDPSVRVIIEEASHVPTYHQDGAVAYNTTIPISGCSSFPPEPVMPTQETFTPSQSLFDQAMASQGIGSTNLTWCAPRGTTSIHIPVNVMQGQANNFLSWTIQPHNIPNVALSQHHLDQSVHSTVTGQHQPSSRRLNFDINKGS